jgi:hypothetical protein
VGDSQPPRHDRPTYAAEGKGGFLTSLRAAMRGVGGDGDGVKAVAAGGEDGGAAIGGEDGGAAAGGKDGGATAGGASSWAPVASPSALVRVSFSSDGY